MAIWNLATNDTGHHHHHPTLTDEQWFLYIAIVVGLVLLAGLMSGLTLGLMSMDVLDMEVKRFEQTGSNAYFCCHAWPHWIQKYELAALIREWTADLVLVL